MSQAVDEILTLKVESKDTGVRVDKWLAAMMPEMTRSALQKLLEDGNVVCNAKSLSKNYKLRGNEEILLHIPPPQPLDIVAQDIPLQIIYEDNDLLVVNKPKGMVVHPAPGNYDRTLVNALMFHCRDRLSGINGILRPGIVHRIDKDTSGLLIVAKNDAAHLGLAEQIKEHSFTRIYEAVVHGGPREDSGTIDAPIGRHPTDRKKMCVIQNNSKPAVTHYEVLARYRGYSHLRLKLETGRTHQIRVHMASIGHPVAGDTVYGPKNTPQELNGQCLHAKVIGFIHPVTKQELYFESELPAYFQDFLAKLQFN